MFTHYYTEGIVLSEFMRGEADKFFTLYTRQFGKISVLGRSIRKGNSKLSMNCQLFSRVRVGFIEGKSYNTLTECFLLSPFKEARNDLGKVSLFYRISELMLSLVKGEEKDERIFLFLLQSFQKINDSSLLKSEIEFFYCFFSFQLLCFLGYEPHIISCVMCGKEISKECYFNPQKGGTVCIHCFKKEQFGVFLSDIRSLRYFLKTDTEKFRREYSHDSLRVLDEFLAFIK